MFQVFRLHVFWRYEVEKTEDKAIHLNKIQQKKLVCRHWEMSNLQFLQLYELQITSVGKNTLTFQESYLKMYSINLIFSLNKLVKPSFFISNIRLMFFEMFLSK